jgi:hypothetical protein
MFYIENLLKRSILFINNRRKVEPKENGKCEERREENVR